MITNKSSKMLSQERMFGLGLSYMLIDTEFRKAEQKLGPAIGHYAETMGDAIIKIDKHLLFFVETTENIIQIETIDVASLYNGNIITGADFKAIIVNHHFLFLPYKHIVYTVVKYDIIKEEFYFDMFASNSQYNKRCQALQKRYVPKISNEAYEMMKNDIQHHGLLQQKIEQIKNYVLGTCNTSIEYNPRRIVLKIQKSISCYLNNRQIINDTELKEARKDKVGINRESNCVNKDVYRFVMEKVRYIAAEKKILEDKNYTVIATTISLLKNNIIHEKESGDDDKHAEALLINMHHRNNDMMNGFKTDDIIFVIRLYNNGTIGCGLPCQRCVKLINMNGINHVVFSIDKNNYKILDMDKKTYTYTTTGNKLLHIDTYLYEEYVAHKPSRRAREE